MKILTFYRWLSIFLIVLVSASVGRADSPITPSVRIISPEHGFVTNHRTLSVVVEFQASADQTGQHLILLQRDGVEIGRIDSANGSGRHTFEVDLSGYFDGPIVLEALADPGAGAADDTARSEPVTVLVDRDLGDGALVGPAGGTIGTMDGRLILDVPAGALPVPTLIKATRVDPAAVPALSGEGPATMSYELEPDGLHFALPVQASLRLDEAVKLIDGSLSSRLSLLAWVAGGVVEVLPKQELTADANTGIATIAGPIAHFSKIVNYEIAPGAGVFVDVIDLPRAAIPVGTEFTPTVIVHDTAESQVQADRHE